VRLWPTPTPFSVAVFWNRLSVFSELRAGQPVAELIPESNHKPYKRRIHYQVSGSIVK
jgi:hypothetical protein